MEARPKYLLLDLDHTLLGYSSLIVNIRFIRLTFWRLRKIGGWKKAVKAMSGLSRVFRHPITSMAGSVRLKETNAERAKNMIAMYMEVPIDRSEKILTDVIGGVFPRLKPFFYAMPGALDFLRWAEGKFPMILATNPVWSQDIIEMRMKWAGIEPKFFKSITHAGRMHSCKPDVAYYNEILEQEGLNPEECMLIGNDLRNDLPAVHAGIRVFIVGGRKTVFKPIDVPNAKAKAWTGTFADLTRMLN